MLRLLGLLLWYCMKNLILNQDALPSCFSHIQGTLFYSLVHPLVGNTRCCHHPHQKNQVHRTLFSPRKKRVKLGFHQKENLISLKNCLRQSVPVTVHSIDERENTHSKDYLPRGGSNVNFNLQCCSSLVVAFSQV